MLTRRLLEFLSHRPGEAHQVNGAPLEGQLVELDLTWRLVLTGAASRAVSCALPCGPSMPEPAPASLVSLVERAQSRRISGRERVRAIESVAAAQSIAQVDTADCALLERLSGVVGELRSQSFPFNRNITGQKHNVHVFVRGSTDRGQSRG